MDIEITVKHENKRVAMQMSKYEYDFARYKGKSCSLWWIDCWKQCKRKSR